MNKLLDSLEPRRPEASRYIMEWQDGGPGKIQQDITGAIVSVKEIIAGLDLLLEDSIEILNRFTDQNLRTLASDFQMILDSMRNSND